MKIKKIFNHKMAQYLVNKGHTVVGTGTGTRGDRCYLFKETKELLKDFTTKSHEIRDSRI